MKNVLISIFFFLVLFFTSSCNFKRFEQKKFFCEKNKLDIELIDIWETRSIKINLENNEISATNNKNIYFLKCEETNFNI